MLNSLFSSQLKDDVAYIVIQRLVGAGPLDVLVECLREQVNARTVVAGHSLELQGGTVHFLPNERNYAFVNGKILAVDLPGNTRLNLDHLFESILDIPNPRAIVILSGMLTDTDGLMGLAQAHARGIPITGTLEANTPVFDMIEQFKNRGWMGELHPPKHLLENIRYNGIGNQGPVRRDGMREAPRILIADDEERIRNSIADMVRAHGMTVDFAMDGLDAVRKLQKCKYDALLLDLQMPELDGIKTLEALKTIDPDLSIIVMTGVDDPTRVQAAKEFNILGVLQKPFAWDKLKKILPDPCKDPAAS